MLVTVKFLKLLGFRGLGQRRSAVRALSLSAIALALPFSTLEVRAENCKDSLEKKFGNVVHHREDRTDRDDDESPAKITEEFKRQVCEKNLKAEVNFRLADQIGKKFGACEQTYMGMQHHFNAVQVAYEDYCQEAAKIKVEASECGSRTDLNACIKKLTNGMDAAHHRYEKLATVWTKRNKDLLGALKNKNQLVIKAYLRDQAKLEQPATPIMEASGGFTEEEYKELIARAGSIPDRVVATNKQGRESVEGDLIEEQKLAEENMKRYLDALSSLENDNRQIDGEIKSKIEQLKARQAGMKSGAGEYVAPAVAVAGAGSGLLKSGTSAASAGVSGSAVAAAALPAAAAVLSASNRNSSGASAASPKLPTGTEKAAELAPTTLSSNDRGPAAAGKEDFLKTAEKTAETTPAATDSNPAFTGSFFASGSSQAGSLKRGGKANGTVEGAAAPGNYANTGTEIGGGGPSFGSRPSSSPSPGGDVTNLLGQMKSLFNFDDPVGGGASNPNAAFGGGIPGGGGATFPSEAGAEVAADGAMPVDPEAVVGAGTPEGQEVQGSDLGKISDSLFVRVHKRHKRCVERGLLATMQGGLRQ